VGRGLGPQQQLALLVLFNAPSGLTIAELATAIEVPDRRTRKIAESLGDRGLVVTIRSRGASQRVWHFQRWHVHASWRERQEFNLAQVIYWARRQAIAEGEPCPQCGCRCQGRI